MSQQTSIETAAGGFFDYETMDPQAIDIYSISSALGKVCRYTGHPKVSFSVAEHSLLCSDLANDRGMSPRLRLLCHVHDAHEAFSGDFNWPMKQWFKARALELGYPDPMEIFEHRCMVATFKAMGIEQPTPEERPVIKEMDQIALATEARELMPSKGEGWCMCPHKPDDTPMYECEDGHITRMPAPHEIRDIGSGAIACPHRVWGRMGVLCGRLAFRRRRHLLLLNPDQASGLWLQRYEELKKQA